MRGHLVKRSEDSWTVVVDVGRDPVTKKRNQKWLTVRGTKREAEAKLTELLHSLETGSYIRPEKMTVGEYLTRWLKAYVSTNTAPSTALSYRMICRCHLIPQLGKILLTELKGEHIQGYYAHLLTEGRSSGKGGLNPKTVIRHHRVLSEALKHAVKWGLVVRNVALSATPPRPNRFNIRVMAPDDVQKFLEAAKDSPYYSLFYLALFTGLRRGELLGLRWRDVDLVMANISVCQTLQRIPHEGFIIREPKTAKSRRQVALPPRAALLLRDLRTAYEATQTQLGKAVNDDTLVFSHPDGAPWDLDSVTHAFTRITERIGLAGLRFHDLRHTHASLMLKQGIHPKIVQERLGHATIHITLDTYSHVLPGLQEAAALRFEEGLFNSSLEREKVKVRNS